MAFNYRQFDTLKGMQLFHYAREMADQSLVDREVVAEFRAQASSMDLQHSEMMLLLLAKSSCEEAHAYLAEFLFHPNVSLRFISSKLVGRLASAGEDVMQMIVRALLESDEPGLREELDGTLRRPANDKAKTIAEGFLSRTGQP